MEVGKNNTTSLDNATTTGQVRHRDSAISTADAEKDDSDADGGDTRFGTHCVDDYNVMAENEPPISADEWKKRVSGKRYKRIMNEITKENEKEMKECLSEYWNERTIWPMFLCIGFVVGFIVLLYMSGTMSYFNGRVAGSHWIDAMEDFNERLQQIKAEERPFPDREDVENWRKCLDDKDFLGLIMRRECNIQWMLRLALGKVKSFGKVFDVRKQGLKKGGYENKLTTNVTSYFKTCLSSQAWGSESFESEIIAFHLDRLTGIYRTLPVVGRSFNYEDLRHVADTTHHRAAQHSLRTAREFCPGSNGKTIPGAMVGWSHFQIQHTHDKMLPALLFDLQHQRRHFAADQTILSTTVDAIDATIHCFHAHRGYFSVAQMRQTLWSQSKPFDEFKDPSDPCYGVSHSDVLASLIAMENVRSAIHDVLTGWYDRPDHNIFEVRSGNGRGPFALIDNDRTQYSSSLVFPARKQRDRLTICNMCRFPRAMFLRLGQLNSQGSVGLGRLVDKAMRYDPLGAKGDVGLYIWQYSVIDRRVSRLMDCMNECIDLFGIEKVLYDDPQDIPPEIRDRAMEEYQKEKEAKAKAH